MASIQDIIKLAGEGKVFVVNEAGEIKLVILPIEQYQKLLLGKLKQQVADIEAINKEIVKAQLEETKPEVTISSIDAAKTLGGKIPREDLRSEVIDPSFNFDAPVDPGPLNEAKKSDFDDI